MTNMAMQSARPVYRTVWPDVGGLSGEPFPKITVVTPNFNGGAFLERTIRSVLDQRYPNLEYIVLDGGSTDGSIEVIEKHRSALAHVVIEPDGGQYDAVAKGFARASGEIFAWLNSDDIFMPWTLRTVAQIFADQPQIQWIMGLPTSMHEGVIRKVANLRPAPRELIGRGLYRHGGLGFIQQESTFWRGSLYRQCGGLDATLKMAGDYDLWRRFARHAELVSVSSILGGFSYHANNRGIRNRDAYLREIEEIFARQPADLRLPAERILARLERRRNVLRKWPRLSGLLGCIDALPGYEGPVLTWDYRDLNYRLTTVKLRTREL